jgi:hypothetical protein
LPTQVVPLHVSQALQLVWHWPPTQVSQPAHVEAQTPASHVLQSPHACP